MDTPSPYGDKDRFPVTQASRHTVFRSYPSNQEMQRAHEQMERSWAHIRPSSVLIAAMGNHWKGGSWQKVLDMMDYTQEQGIYCALSEIQDRCFQPYDALGTMRNEAILTAMFEGFQNILYIDNDVQPDKDVLVKLLRLNQPIVAPYVTEPGTGNGLHGPKLTVNTGLQRAKWSVLSMLLFQTAVFRGVGTEFWRDALGADEGYHFLKLAYHGYYLTIDTDIQLVVGGRPLYPLALNRLSSGSMADVGQASKILSAKIVGLLARKGMPILDADHMEIANALTDFERAAKGDRDVLIQEKIQRFVEIPDRRAINPNDPNIRDGEYAPYLVRIEQAKAASQQATTLTPSGTAVVTTSTVEGENVSKALAFSGAGNG